MAKVNNNVFERAVQVAEKSTMLQRHGAVIVKNGNIIAEGYNHHTSILCHQWSVHSEVAALMNLRPKHRKSLGDAIMLVVRLGPPSDTFKFKNSRPCEKCREAINKAGIKKVFYT